MKTIPRMPLPMAFMIVSAISVVMIAPAVAAPGSVPVPANSGTAQGTAALTI